MAVHYLFLSLNTTLVLASDNTELFDQASRFLNSTNFYSNQINLTMNFMENFAVGAATEDIISPKNYLKTNMNNVQNNFPVESFDIQEQHKGFGDEKAFEE